MTKREIIEKNRQKLINNPTKAEQKMKFILAKLGVTYTFQQVIEYRNTFFIADFVVTNKEGKRYVLELDGGYHFNYKQKKADESRSSKIRVKAGYGVLRFKNDTVLKRPNDVVQKLHRFKII